MTSQITPESQPVPPTVSKQTQSPQLDERLWQAWVEKNKKFDRLRFARRVKVTAILVSLLTLVALFRSLFG